MNVDEILKALECCFGDTSCTGCLLEFAGAGCRKILRDETIDLIKRQQAETKRLNNNMDAMVKEHNNLMKTIREDVIREFEEKVKAKMTNYNQTNESYSFNVLMPEDITLIAKGMKGR